MNIPWIMLLCLAAMIAVAAYWLATDDDFPRLRGE